ncbi:TPR repeat-containing protein [Microseira wollei NIES-4236]|uniref:TPR repeat-containing protein n=2 Tax=Microseira wollei TaxID=467598 RepID=A0AAV3XI02_9CYAN|nr:TPR repeat-containing protein [Microseira wollei NIES-4236]
MTQNNLANAYSNGIKGDKAENLETAIRYYLAAIEVRTRSAFPQDWAMTQNNLANAYSNGIKGDKAENLETAIRYYLAAIEVRNRSAFPQDWADTLFNLGLAYQKNNQKHLAYDAFADAIETVELMRYEIVSGDESKQKLAEKHNQIYRLMIEVCLAMGKPTVAIEYAERSKTRNLVEQILTRDLHKIFPPEVVKELEQLRDEIATNQNQIQTGKADNPQTLAQSLQQLRQQRNDLQNRYLPIGFGFNFARFQATLDDSTAIIQWYITFESFHTFIFTRYNPQPFVLSATIDDRKALVDWANTYIDDYYGQKDNWRTQLTPRLQELAKILHLDEILAHLPKDCQQLILIPNWHLHLFPLHALPVGESCRLDIFPKGVSYAPSCQLLLQAQKRQRPDFSHLFAIQNPTEDLTYTDLEVEVITQYFQPVNVLKKAQATLTAINNTPLNTFHCAHFSCHGYFDLTDARKSALILANAPLDTAPTQPNSERYLSLRNGEIHDLEKCLTLDRILSLKLEKCRLVTLSACETGLIDFLNYSDEYIGLPSGFLIAGSRAVVSSLWTVSDLSTAFLMMKFYQNLPTYKSLTLALNHAQKWLRNLTCEEFEAVLEQLQPQIDQILAQLKPGKRFVLEEIIAADLKEIRDRQPYPFANPFYWAAFTAAGV